MRTRLTLLAVMAPLVVTGCISMGGDVPCPAGRAWAATDTPDGGSERWCRTPDGVADGRYERLGPDGQTLVEGWFTNNLAEATWYGYDLSGNLLWQREWNAGRACGTWFDFTTNEPVQTAYPDCNSLDDPPDPAPPSADFGWDGLSCPDGATLAVDPTDVNARFCVVDGRRHGPFGRWFDAALTHKQVNGFYTNDQRDNTWHVWYEDGGLREIGTYVDDHREGRWFAYAPEGWRESEGAYRAGLRDGLWLTFHGNGQRRSEGSYTNDRREGPWRTFHPNGALDQETSYTNDLRNGPFRSHHPTGGLFQEGAYSADARTGTWRTFTPDGQRVSEGTYTNGARTGTWRTYTPDGEPASEGPFVEGLEHGTWTYWSRIGDRRYAQRGEVVHGLAQGLWRGTWDTGAAFDAVTYIDNQRQGAYAAFWPDGRTFAEGTFLNGLEQGPWRYWHENGQLAAEGTYHRGFKVPGTWQYFTEEGRATTEEVIF